MTTDVSSDDKLMAALSYWGSIILWFIPALVIYILKKDSSMFIKKHSLQALMLNLAFAVISIAITVIGGILGTITFGVGSLLMMLVNVAIFLGLLVYVVMLGIQAFQGEDKDIPYITNILRSNMGL